MASNGANSKRKRGSGSGDEETQEDKKLRLSNAGPSTSNQARTAPLAISSQLVQSVNGEWSRTMTTKRNRSNSSDSFLKDAKMTVQLSSSNPEPTSFLMGVLATELGNIEQMLSPGATQTSPTSPSTPSTATMSSPQSSPDHYDSVVLTGNRILEKLQGTTEFDKYNTYR